MLARFRRGGLLVLLLLSGFFFVALRLERRRLIGLQRDGEDAVGRVVVEALIELADAREEIAPGKEEKIFTFGIEDRIRIAIKAAGNLRGFLLLE